MAKDLRPRWRRLCSSFDEHNDRITNRIDDLMDWAVQYLGISLHSFGTTILTDQIQTQNCKRHLIRLLFSAKP